MSKPALKKAAPGTLLTRPPTVPVLPWRTVGERVIQVKKIDYTLKVEVTVEQLLAYTEELELESEVYFGLVAARAAFGAGQAGVYTDAHVRLRDLILGMKSSERKLAEMSEQFSEFFSPSGLCQAFAGYNSAYSKMLKKLLPELVGVLEKAKG